MKKLTLALLLTLLCVGLTSLAVADNVTLQLINHPYGQIGPYGMSLDGSYLELVCGSFTKEITDNEIWYVQAMTYHDFVTAGTVWGHSADDWNEAAWFAQQLLAHPGNTQYQQDVWGAVDGGYLTPADDAYYDNNISGHWTFSGVWYLPLGTPSNENATNWKIDGDTYNYGTPQPFYMPTPEPASLFLLGSGLLGLGMLRFWKH